MISFELLKEMTGLYKKYAKKLTGFYMKFAKKNDWFLCGICKRNAGLYMKCNTGLKLVKEKL